MIYFRDNKSSDVRLDNIAIRRLQCGEDLHLAYITDIRDGYTRKVIIQILKSGGVQEGE